MMLELTRTELRGLMQLATLAELVLDHVDENEATAETLELVSQVARKVYEAGLAAGIREIVRHEPARDEFSLREPYENGVYSEILQHFEDNYFWNELAHLLAERDLRNRHGGQLDPVEYSERLFELEERYMDIFSESGVDALHVISSEPHQ